MTDKEKIRVEVKRLYGTFAGKVGMHGECDICCKLLSFIDSLQEEPVSEELDEEIERYRNAYYRGIHSFPFSKIARHFANWQKQQDQSIIELAEDHAMLAGMEKMREQIMKDAVVMEAHEEYGELWGDIRKFNTKKGKKYKVIIIKQEDD